MVDACIRLSNGSSVETQTYRKGHAHRPMESARSSSHLLPHPINAVGSAAGACDVEAGKAEHDCEFAAVQKRDEAARKMLNEIGERHFTAQDEGHDPRAEAEDQKAAEHQFDRSGAPEQRKRCHLVERRDNRKLEHFGEAVLK